MTIQEQIKLAPYTTFKIGGPAAFFCVIKSEDDLVQAVALAEEKNLRLLVLGGGSNVLISDEGFGGLVIKNEIEGIEVGEADGGSAPTIISAAAGESWDKFVGYTVENGFYGVENLSAIPGTVGAAPVQNIGAYGAEVAQTIESIRAYDVRAKKFIELSAAECNFGYRDSLFKQKRGKYIITKVNFKLSRTGQLKMDYKDVQEYFAKKGITTTGTAVVGPTLAQLRQAIIEIRASKLPDWKVWGTAGSFFKNPSIPAEQFEQLKKKYPDLPGFPEKSNQNGKAGLVKISLGWILDKLCNARGLMVGNVGTYQNQALVLIAKSGAKASEVYSLSRDLMRQVKEKTGIDIEAEVEWVV